MLQRELAKLEAANRALERDAERFRRRQAIEARLADVRRREAWAKVERRQRQLDEDGRALELAKRLLREQREAAAEDAGPLADARARGKEAQEKLRALEAAGGAGQPQATSAKRRQLREAIAKHVRALGEERGGGLPFIAACGIVKVGSPDNC